MESVTKLDYGQAILSGFEYLLKNYNDVFVIGQGLWSPWYVGHSMTDLDKKYGTNRIIDTPVCEAASTGAAVGASLCGMKPIVVHPRMDFMLYAMDPIVNQAAKWRHMFGGQASAGVTIRAIINRGGEQGAQHSQALHSWFAHIPGLRVVMPCSVSDARDLLISSVLCPDPVLYIDDRWLYEESDNLKQISEVDLSEQGPRIVSEGTDVTIVGVGYSSFLGNKVANELMHVGISAEVVDVRVLNPLKPELILESVSKTGRLFVIDGGWSNCGFAGEIIARAAESLEPSQFRCAPVRVTLPDAPAPCSSVLEKQYYPDKELILSQIIKIFKDNE